MFDIGFWEIAVIAAIMLVVLGPERLPGVARTAGFWLSKLRRMVNDVKSEVKKEMDAAELKELDDAKNQIHQASKDVHQQINKNILSDEDKNILADTDSSKTPDKPTPSNPSDKTEESVDESGRS